MMSLGNLIFHGCRNKKIIALTFDDSPSEETPKILDLLKKQRIKSTFFVLGKRITGREKVIKRMFREGHKIGNHSHSHGSLWFKSLQTIEQEIILCDKILWDKCKLKTDLFRPPYFRLGLAAWMVSIKLKKKVIFSDTISDDWKLKGVEFTVNKVIENTKNGSIINLHDYLENIGRNKEIVEITKRIILGLKKRGYKFVTISKLLNLKN